MKPTHDDGRSPCPSRPSSRRRRRLGTPILLLCTITMLAAVQCRAAAYDEINKVVYSSPHPSSPSSDSTNSARGAVFRAEAFSASDLHVTNHIVVTSGLHDQLLLGETADDATNKNNMASRKKRNEEKEGTVSDTSLAAANNSNSSNSTTSSTSFITATTTTTTTTTTPKTTPTTLTNATFLEPGGNGSNSSNSSRNGAVTEREQENGVGGRNSSSPAGNGTACGNLAPNGYTCLDGKLAHGLAHLSCCFWEANSNFLV